MRKWMDTASPKELEALLRPVDEDLRSRGRSGSLWQKI